MATISTPAYGSDLSAVLYGLPVVPKVISGNEVRPTELWVSESELGVQWAARQNSSNTNFNWGH